MTYAGNLQNRIEKLLPREPILVRNILKEFPNIHAVDMALHRMEKKGQIIRFEKGIYYKPMKTRLGQLGIDKDALIKAKYLYKDGELHGYITGPQVWNQWGLTTQIPKGQWIALADIRQKKVDKMLDLLIIKSRGDVTEKSVSALQFLDVLEYMDQIQDSDKETVLMKLMEIFKNRMDVQGRVSIIDQARHYPKTVQVLAGLIAETAIKNEPYFTVILSSLKDEVCKGKKVKLDFQPDVFEGNRAWGNYYASAVKR